jgi:ferredoxin
MIYKLKKEKINEVLDGWAQEYRVFVPEEKGRLVEYNPKLEINWDTVPVWGGIKEFVFPPRFAVVGDKTERPVTVIVGARNCDLRALAGVFDKLFLEEEPKDTVYKTYRDSIRLVSIDCFSQAETCFCVSIGGAPYSEKDFDLNLSFLEDDVLIDSPTDNGRELIEGLGLDEAGDKEIKRRAEKRDTAKKKVSGNFELDFEKDKFGEKIEKNLDQKYWEEKRETCMQCGGCNFCCPTCYCNVLNELSDKKQLRKVLQWDSCHFPGYSRVAGGATPRPELWQRFRHRYLCKFTLMLEEFGMTGCTGCGRCIQVCPGEIDMRETIKGLYGSK